MHMYRPGRQHAQDADVQVVTSAGPGRSEQVAGRRKAYVAIQVTRVAAFVIAIVAPLPLLVRGILIAVAGALSLFSVTAANAPYPRAGGLRTPVPVATRPALSDRPEPPAAAG